MDPDATRPLQDAPDGPPQSAGPGVGQLVGRYVLLAELGRGGEGQVFEAFDTELERKVALKLLRGGSATLSARREARAQAKLDHPAVVSIFDVGDADDQAYIAMELMDATPFERWAASAGPGALLGALREVASGIEAAHAAGLVHGDIKPSNILRSTRGQAKLSDFGVARAADADAGLAGTRAFMAPELFDGAPAGPESDQYAFCVTAWQLFHGRHPTAREASKAPTVHAEGPDTDGSELDTGEHGPAPGDIPPWTADGVPRAVQSAIMRGLDPDPEARWPSMGALEAALRPPRQRRHWLTLGALGVAASAAATVSFMGTSGEADPCVAAADRVRAVWTPDAQQDVRQALEAPGYGTVQRRAIEALDAWATAWADDVHASCRATHVERSQSAELLDLRSACYRDALAGFGASVAVLGQSDDASRPFAHAVFANLPELAPCRDALALKDGPQLDPATSARLEAVRADLQRAVSLRLAGRGSDALEALEAIEPEVEALELPRLTLEVLLERAQLATSMSDNHLGVTLAKEALALSLSADEPALLDDVLILLTSLVGHDVGGGEEAEVYAELLRARAGREGLDPGDHGAALAALALQQAGAGDYPGGIETFERALEVRAPARDEDLEFTSILGAFAMTHGYAQEPKRALALYEQVLEVRKRLVGETHPLIAHTLDGIAMQLRLEGRFEEALKVAQRSARILEATAPGGHDELSSNANSRAQALAHLGRIDEARVAFESALAHAKLAFPGGSRGVAILQMNLAKFLAEEFEPGPEAVELAREAVRMHADVVGAKHVEMIVTRIHYGQLLGMAGRLEAGRTELEHAIALARELLPPGHPDLHYGRLRLAQLELRAHRWPKAARIAADVADALEADPAAPPSLRETAAELLDRARSEREP